MYVASDIQVSCWYLIRSLTGFLIFLHGKKYRVRVNCSYSGWHDVNSGIPQGSVLGPLLFLIYINDLIDRCGLYSDIYVFADDAKFFLHIMEPQDSDLLQYALNELQNWSHKWLLNLNIKKCQVLSTFRPTECGQNI